MKDNPCIIDASFFLSFLLPNETNYGLLQPLEDVFTARSKVYTPRIFLYETHNTILVSEKKGRITHAYAKRCIDLIKNIPIELLDESSEMDEIFTFAKKYTLTIYDASYAYFSRKLKIPLLSLDKHLAPFSSIK